MEKDAAVIFVLFVTYLMTYRFVGSTMVQYHTITGKKLFPFWPFSTIAVSYDWIYGFVIDWTVGLTAIPLGYAATVAPSPYIWGLLVGWTVLGGIDLVELVFKTLKDPIGPLPDLIITEKTFGPFLFVNAVLEFVSLANLLFNSKVLLYFRVTNVDLKPEPEVGGTIGFAAVAAGLVLGAVFYGVSELKKPTGSPAAHVKKTIDVDMGAMGAASVE